MAGRNLHPRLARVGRRIRDRAYRRLAAFWRDGVRPDEELEAVRVFRALAEWEAAEGTPLETLLSRLPPGLAQAIRQELGAMIAGGDAGFR